MLAEPAARRVLAERLAMAERRALAERLAMAERPVMAVLAARRALAERLAPVAWQAWRAPVAAVAQRVTSSSKVVANARPLRRTTVP